MTQAHTVFLGMATTDFIAVVPRLPTADEVFELHSLSVHGGGPAATAAVACARLGGCAWFVGAIGNDSVSIALQAELEREQVNTALLQRQATGEAPAAVILVPAGPASRSIMYSRGTVAEPAWNAELQAAIESAALLHLDGFHIHTALRAARCAKAAAVPVSFDGGAGQRWPHIEELLPLVDIMVVARAFAKLYTDEDDPLTAARRLEEFGAREVVITDGANGAWYRHAGKEGHVPAFKVDVVDTTGAGDVFHGAYVYARQAGEPPSDAVRFASAVAALKCGEKGGRTGIPTLEQAKRFLNENSP